MSDEVQLSRRLYKALKFDKISDERYFLNMIRVFNWKGVDLVRLTKDGVDDEVIGEVREVLEKYIVQVDSFHDEHGVSYFKECCEELLNLKTKVEKDKKVKESGESETEGRAVA